MGVSVLTRRSGRFPALTYPPVRSIDGIHNMLLKKHSVARLIVASNVFHGPHLASRFVQPKLLSDGFEDEDLFYDLLTAKLGRVLPKSGERFTFRYEYDFGDCWMQEIVLEGCLISEKRRRYPICVEGENAYPPEDVGGVGGYARYLKAIADPDHEDHDELRAWRGPFDPAKFDEVKTTRSMCRGIFDWRNKA